MSQTYTNPVAIERMREGNCPECGGPVRHHDGWGGPGCTLTDYGVAERIEHRRRLDEVERALDEDDDAYHERMRD